MVRALLQFSESGLDLREQPQRPLVGGDELFERGGTVGQLADRALELAEQGIEVGRGHVAVAATRPRIPLTKRPASSPENVLARSMDSLMAAFVGTLRSMAIS